MPNPENLVPTAPGEVRNPTGINGWTKARARFKDELIANSHDLSKVLISLAKKGDMAAMKMAAGALLPTIENKVEHSGKVEFKWSETEVDTDE